MKLTDMNVKSKMPPQSFDPKYHRQMLKKFCRRGEKLLRRYQKAVEQGSEKQAAALDSLLTSFGFRALAFRLANRKLCWDRRQPPLALLMMAKMLSWQAPLLTAEKLIARPKKSGSVRLFFDFELERRAIFEGLALILSAHLKLRPFQYDSQGIHAAVAAVKGHIESGCKYAAQIDIRSHFASFDCEALAHELPLGSQLVARWVMAQAIPIGEIAKRGGIPVPRRVLRTLAHQGIPPGSVLSAMVAQIIGSKLAWEPLGTASLANIADNYSIMDTTKAKLVKASNALRSAVEALPGGHFTTTIDEIIHVNDGFVFLGHHLRKVKCAVRTRPSAANENAFYNRLGRYDERLYQLCCTATKDPSALVAASDLAADMYLYARSWVRAFKLCDGIGEHLSAVELKMQPYLEKLGLSFNQLKKHRNPEAKWSFAELS